MKLIETKEIQENGVTYIVNTYDNGTVEQFAKPDPNAVPTEPERQPAVTNEQLQADIQSVKDDNLALMMGIADLYTAVTSNGGEV